MPSAIKGVLIECDPSIRALIVHIDAQTHGVIILVLDDTHLLVDENRVEYIKSELNKLLAKNTFVPEEEK